MPLAPGSRIGSHVVLSLIGEGGMGEVYKARDTTLDRDVAIKRLPDAVAGDPERLARFEREAKTLAALNHPNVAQIYAVESGTIVMELVPGETLRGPLPLDTALDYAAQIASALDAAHDKGIIHRDLKPGNVMITPDGVIKVLDFSLAGRDRTSPEADPERSPTLTSPVTSAGLIMGTAAYMAPEQASGRPVDKRADIFAFGVVLWEMLTGRRMFEGETISHVLAAVLTQEPDLSAVPPRVRHLLSRCLEKDPKKRLRDIGDAMSLVLPADSSGSRADVATSGGSRAARAWHLSGWIAAGVLAAVLAATAWSRPVAPPAVVTPIVRFQVPRAVDIYNQTATTFAVSPDGKSLAYYDESGDGRLALFVRNLSTGDVRRVPNSETFSPRSHALFWSFDGQQLVRGLQTGASVVEVATGTSRPLCDCRFFGGSWNRDGVILLGSDRNVQGIRRLSVNESTPVEITTVDTDRGEQDAWPVLLPDGRHFLFTSTKPGAPAVTYIGALDGSEPRRLVEGSRRAFVPASGDRPSLLLGIDAAGLVAQGFDLDTLAVTGAPMIIQAEAVAVSASENGVLATSVAGSRPQTIPTWFDRKGMSMDAAGEAGFHESVALSPDGRRLVTASSNTGAPGQPIDLWVYDLVRGLKTRLTFNRANTPVWSSDGTKIAYSSLRGTLQLPYQRNADGTGSETPLFAHERNAWVNDWSKDGRWVIFASPKRGTETNNDLWSLPMSGGSPGTPVSYISAPGRQQQAQLSPDGRFVAYGSDESGTFDIYVQPFPDAGQGQWMVSSGGGSEPRWRRDGKELFYFSGQSLIAVPVSLTPTFSSGTPVKLFDAAIQVGYTNDSHRWQVAPDGRFLLLVPAGRQQAPPVEVIVNWPALLPR
jgi:Tol biopolymer transport system component